jgi:D-sedoheptulose 7-phosphate isomerase
VTQPRHTSRSAEAVAFADDYLEHLGGLLRGLDREAIGNFVQTLFDARERQARIFFVGNGGSAATASHFANDVAIGALSDRPFQAISLCDNVPILTAIANDRGYDQIFVVQLKVLMQPGDLVVAISASGNSPNVVRAVEYANANGAVTVGLVGFDGGRMKEIAQHCIHVVTPKGEYGPIEDIHMVLDHLIGAYLIRDSRKRNAP